MKFFDGKGPKRVSQPEQGCDFRCGGQAAILTEGLFPGADNVHEVTPLSIGLVMTGGVTKRPNERNTFGAAVQAAILTEDRFPGAGFDRARVTPLSRARDDWRRDEMT